MNHIDKVREGLEGALELRACVAESLMSTYANATSARSAELEAVAIEEGIHEALSALSAHEAEIKELARDAERYRCLRDSGNYSPGRFSAPWGLAMRGEYTAEELDAAVDAAIAKVQP